MEISRLAIIYGSTGGEDAVRMDKRVRTSLVMTEKSAVRGSRTTERWFDAHKTAILGIATATIGLLAALLRASPAVSAELSSIRLAFSMMAMEIGDRLLPIFIKLEEWSWKLSERFANMSTPMKDAITVVVIVIAVLALLLIAVVAVIAILGMAGITGTMLAVVGAIVLLGGALAYLVGRFGVLKGVLIFLVVLAFFPLVAILYVLERQFGAVTKAGEMFKKFLSGLKTLAKIIVTSFKNTGQLIYDAVHDAIMGIIDDAPGWGKDFVDNFTKGMGSIGDKVTGAFEPIAEVFSFDRPKNDRWIFNSGGDFGSNFISGVKGAFSNLGMDNFMTTPTATAAPAAAPMVGGNSVSITIAQGAITMMGGETSDISMDTIVDKLYNRIRDDMGARF